MDFQMSKSRTVFIAALKVLVLFTESFICFFRYNEVSKLLVRIVQMLSNKKD